MNIDVNIFNTEKTDYETPSLFMGQKPGLADTINKKFPNIMRHYDRIRALDWRHDEFDFGPCNTEFKTCNKSDYDMMIFNLAWQWETDAIAGRKLLSIVEPFVTSDELWWTWTRIADNENIHAMTYSEIVRNSFDNPQDVIAEILSVSEAFERLESVASVFSTTMKVSQQLARGEIERDQRSYNVIFVFVCAMYMLERIQFAASFIVTFAMGNNGKFIPIANALQKICVDELEVHVEFDKDILNYELQNEHGLTAFNKCKSQINKLLLDIIEAEFKWIENKLFTEGRELAGISKETLKEGVLWQAAEVFDFFGIKSPYTMPTRNPVPWMDDWVRIDATQKSPQEERPNSYMTGMVVHNDTGKTFNINL